MGTRGSFERSGVINVAAIVMSLLGCPDFISLITCQRRVVKGEEGIREREIWRENVLQAGSFRMSVADAQLSEFQNAQLVGFIGSINTH